MKACVLLDKNNIEYKEVIKPALKSGEVLVKVKACGICSSDFNRVYGDSAYFFPIVLGHEFSGEIVEVSEGIPEKFLNKKVTVFPLLPCFECRCCKEKHYAQCEKYSYFGSRQNGAMTEYITVPYWNIKILPDDILYKVAALSEPAAVGINAINKISSKNKTLCISGSGTIAILCGLYAKVKGFEVSFVTRNKIKENFLRELGFQNFVQENNLCSNQFDILLECVGTNNSLLNCVKLVKPQGEIILVGNPAGDMELCKKDYWKLLRSEITLKGVWNSNYKNCENDDWDNAIKFLYENQNLIKNVITDEFSLKDGIEAFEKMKTKDKCHVKGVFLNEE